VGGDGGGAELGLAFDAVEALLMSLGDAGNERMSSPSIWISLR